MVLYSLTICILNLIVDINKLHLQKINKNTASKLMEAFVFLKTLKFQKQISIHKVVKSTS